MRRGIAIVTIGGALGKLLALLVQFVLGHVLDVELYAVYGMILSLQMIVYGLKDAGIGKFLIQNGNFEKNWLQCAIFGLLANLVGIVLVVLLFPYLEDHFSGLESMGMILIPLMLVLPLQMFSSVFSSKLKIDGKFMQFALVELLAVISQSIIVLSCLAVGVGVYSVVVGLSVYAIIQVVGYWFYVKPLPIVGDLKIGRVLEIAKACKWIIVIGFLVGYSLRSDFFVLAGHLDADLIGFYVFGVNLVLSVCAIISNSTQVVAMSLLSKLAKTGRPYQIEFDKLREEIDALSASILLMLYVSSPWVVGFLWGGKWDQAVIVVQIASIYQFFKLQSVVFGNLLEANAMWRFRVFTLLIDVFAVVLLAIYALNLSDLKQITVLVFSGRTLVCFTQIALVSIVCKKSFVKVTIRQTTRFVSSVLVLIIVKQIALKYCGGFNVAAVEVLVMILAIVFVAVFYSRRVLKL